MELTFIDLFRGVGGFRLALESVGWRCVWSNDWDEEPNKVYYSKEGWNTENDRSGDIKQIRETTIPKAELLCAGFPCQAFSVAGEGEGLEDPRGELYLEIARIIESVKPKLFLLENVKNLLSHDEGRTARTIFSTFAKLGYIIEWQVLDSQCFGVPQHRERVFIVGHLRGERTRLIFPFLGACGADDGKDRGKPLERQRLRSDIAHTLDAGYGKQRNSGESYVIQTTHSKTDLRINKEQCPTLLGRMGTGGNNIPLVLPCLTPRRDEKRQNGRRFKEDGEPAFTLTTQDVNGIIVGDGEKLLPREFTEVECERLQGFPDNWSENIKSRQNRYKALGNAVTVNVIQILGILLKWSLQATEPLVEPEVYANLAEAF